MAYDASNNNSDQQTVASSTPLDQGNVTTAQSDQQQNQTNSGSNPEPIQANSPSQTSNPQQSSGSSKPASSGMFTNIQKYVQKNKPQVQKMSENSLSKVREASDSIKNKQAETINQFTQRAQASGLQNTQENVQKIQDISNQAANQVPQTVPTPVIPEAEQTTNRVAEATTQPTVNPQDSQFESIINAKYTGPQSLADTQGLYTELAKQAQESSRIGQMAQSQQGRENLLREMYTQGNKQYTQGASNLDNFLMGTDAQGIENLKNAGQDIGTKQQILNEITSGTRNIAGQTSRDIDETRKQAREAFSNIANARQDTINARIDDVVQNWDTLPTHFKEALTGVKGGGSLSQLEASTLGMTGDTRLFDVLDEYNIDDLIGGVEANRSQLISQDEQANLDRLNALRMMAKGDTDLSFNRDDTFFDSTQAGKQSSFDALGLDNFADKLAQREENFQSEIGKDVIGRGKKKVSRGNAWGTKTKTYRAEMSEKLENILQQQRDKGINAIMEQDPSVTREEAEQIADSMNIGYDANKEITRLNTNPQLLEEVAEISQNLEALGIDTSNLSPTDLKNISETEDYAKSWSSLNAGGGALGPELDDMSEGERGEFLANLASTVQKLESVPGQLFKDTGSIFKGAGGDIGNFIGDRFNDVGKLLGSFGAIDTKAMNQIGSAKAKAKAAQNLQRNIDKKAEDIGVNNIARVENTEENMLRQEALMNLLRNIDKNNIKGQQ